MVRQRLPHAKTEFNQTVQKLSEIEKQMELVKQKIESIPAENRISATREKWERYQHAQKENEIELKLLAEKKETLENKISMARASLVKRMEDNINCYLTAEDDERMVRFSQKTRNTLEQLKTIIIKEHLGEIEKSISSCFKKLVQKKHLIHKISISPEDYSVRIRNDNDEEVHPDELSAGERQLLAVSILWGLGQVAQNPLPVIVDTPLGRLDGVHRRNMLRNYFPHASNQVIILATDQEIGPREHEILKPHISQEYTLIYDEEEKTTEIKTGYEFSEGDLMLCQ
jgi:DNA sulfur modification protein DndD